MNAQQSIPSMPSVRFCYIGKGERMYGEPPAYATQGSVGIDLRACLSPEHMDAAGALCLAPGERVALGTGLAIEPLPTAGTVLFSGFVYSRSGLGATQGLTVAQGVGVIDLDYRGEIKVVLLNTSHETRRILDGDRIAQLVFQPVYRVQLEQAEQLGETTRGAGGFGHTGAR